MLSSGSGPGSATVTTSEYNSEVVADVSLLNSEKPETEAEN